MSRFFGEQATRLLREQWDSTDDLAEELYAMATADGPNASDQPLQLTRTGDQPAIIIYDYGNGTGPPIQIIKVGSGDPQSTCCSGSVGTGGGGPSGGHPPPSPPPTKLPPDPGSGGPVTPAPPGSPPTYRRFGGALTIRLFADPPDTFHIDQTEPSFGAVACLPYSPPAISGPTTAFFFAEIVRQLEEYLAKPTVAPFLDHYEVISDTVSGPGAVCTP